MSPERLREKPDNPLEFAFAPHRHSSQERRRWRMFDPLRSRGLYALGAALLAVTLAASGCAGSAEEGTAGGEQVLERLPDGFPSKPITLWSSYGPGHSNDLFNRALASAAQKYSPVPVRVEARDIPGLDVFGLVDYLRTQNRTDGHDVFGSNFSVTALQTYTRPDLVDRSLDEIQLVLPVVQAPVIFGVPLDSPFNSLQEVFDYAKAHPDELTAVFGSAGSGHHSSWMTLAAQAGVTDVIVELPTDNVGQSQVVLAGGGADIAALNYETGIEERFKFLAVSGDRRFSGLPDVPTLSELGYELPYIIARSVTTFPEVDQARVEWLAELFTLAAADPEFAESQAGFDVITDISRDEMVALRDRMAELMVPGLWERGFALRPYEP